jgi:hypothetical protein
VLVIGVPNIVELFITLSVELPAAGDIVVNVSKGTVVAVVGAEVMM